MNGHPEYGRYGQDRAFTNGHYDPYGRDDPYRDDMRGEEDVYRRPVRNGGGRSASDRFNNDHLLDQSSVSDFNSSEPAFELDHLATFAAGGSRKGTMHVEDGLRKLRQMENTTGIWTMRCILLVERRFIVILDKNSGEELERFPVHSIQDPTAIFKNDRREIYNNLVLFTVMDDTHKKDAQADMHIFQSVRTPAQNIVDEIFAAKRGQTRVSNAGEYSLLEIFRNHHNQTIAEVMETQTSTVLTSAQNTHNTHTALQQQRTASASDHRPQNTPAGRSAQSAPGEGSRQPPMDQSWMAAQERSQVVSAGLNQLHLKERDHHMYSDRSAGDVSGGQQEYLGYQSHAALVQNEQRSSGTEVVEELYARVDKSRSMPPNSAADTQHTAVTKQQWYKIPPPPSGPAPEPPGSSRDPYDFSGFRESIEHRQYNFNQFGSSQYGASQFNNGGGFIGGGQRSSMMARPSYLPYKEREDEIGSNELLERDVPVETVAGSAPLHTPETKDDTDSDFSVERDKQLLNHCFDDIEKFVARLQQAAEAYKELERRKKERGGKGKKNASGDGMLGHRARPPPAQDFVDIFQKFKLSFNLLAKLKAHIHDPNAPELVHFLFTPLSLIYEASRDPIHGNMNLGDQAVAPVLTLDAKQLLLNCLTSKEIELWQALGKHWTTSKDEWKGYIPPYVPRFYDGWQPAPTLVDEPMTRPIIETPVSVHQEQIQRRAMPPLPMEDDQYRGSVQNFDRFDPEPRNMSASVVSYQQNYRSSERRGPEPLVQPPPPISQPLVHQRPMDDNQVYLEELRRMGATVYEVLHDRQGKNQKELTVRKGEYLQVMDSSRNWWKVRNYKGESGYCPYTILKEVSSAENGRVGNYR